MGREAGRSSSNCSIVARRGEAGLLRLDFEPDDEADLELISWADFFDKFGPQPLKMEETAAFGELPSACGGVR